MTTDLVTIEDYAGLGEKVAKWAKDEPRPATIGELRNELAGIAAIPTRYTNLVIVQSTSNTLVLHLPEKQPLIDAEAEVAPLSGSSAYPIPPFYEENLPGLEMLYCRIGDYCMAQCK